MRYEIEKEKGMAGEEAGSKIWVYDEHGHSIVCFSSRSIPEVGHSDITFHTKGGTYIYLSLYYGDIVKIKE